MTKYVRHIDGLRGLAILLVMTLHYGLTDYGWIGVQLFFVLSGYLITGILLRQKERGGSVISNLKSFWIRRSLRIFPLYFGYLGFFLLTYLIWNFPVYFGNFAPYLFTYTFNFTRTTSWWLVTPFFTHLWSLSIEEQFYIFFPFLIFLLPRKRMLYFLISLIIVGPIVRLYLGEVVFNAITHVEDKADSIYWNTFTHLDAFCYGGLLHFIRDIKSSQFYFRSIVMAFLILFLIGSFSYFSYGFVDGHFLRDFGYALGRLGHYEFVWHYTVLNIFFAILIDGLENGDREEPIRKIKRFFEGDLLVAIGKVSYGMYVFHWSIYSFVFYPFVKGLSYELKILVFIPYFLAVYLLSLLSYNIYERKFLLLKSKFE